MSRSTFSILLTAAAVLCGLSFKSDASGLALFGYVFCAATALYLLAILGQMQNGPGAKPAVAYAGLMLTTLVAGMLPSKYPYLSLVVGLSYAALAIGCGLGFALGRNTFKVLAIVLVPAALWTSWVLLRGMVGLGGKSSLFDDSNSYATVLNITFTLVLIVLTGPTLPKWARYASQATLLTCLGGMYVVHSKGAWLALIVTLVGIAIVASKNLSLGRRHWVALLLVTGIGAASVIDRVSAEKTEHRDGRSTTSRRALIEGTAAIIQANPMGVGIGQWFRAYEQVRVGKDLESNGAHAHNDYLEATAEVGILGLAALALPGLLALRMLLRLRRESDPLRARRQAGLIALIGVCAVQAGVNFTYKQPGFNLLVGLACGALLAFLGQVPTATPTAQSRLSLSSAYVALTALLISAALSYATLNAQSIPEPAIAKALPWLKDERVILLLSNLNPFDQRPRVAYAALHHRITANEALPNEVRESSYYKAMGTYLALNKAVPDDFQLLATAGGLANDYGRQFDPSARALAEALLRRAFELAPTQVGIVLGYADVLYQQGRYDEAEAAVRNALARVPDVLKPTLDKALSDIHKNRRTR